MNDDIYYVTVYIINIQFRQLIARLPGDPYRLVFSGKVLHPRGMRGCSFELVDRGQCFFHRPNRWLVPLEVFY